MKATKKILKGMSRYLLVLLLTIGATQMALAQSIHVSGYTRSTPGTVSHRTHSYSARSTFTTTPRQSSFTTGVARGANGRIKRSEAAKHEFMRMTDYPNGRPG